MHCPPGAVFHVIQPGDNLSRLADRYGSNEPAIVAANPGLASGAIYVGKSVCIPIGQLQSGPESPAAQSCPFGFTQYEVQSGDTLEAIANRFRIMVQTLTAINPGLSDPLPVGQVICIPGAAPTGGT